jgi:hypothetical protein
MGRGMAILIVACIVLVSAGLAAVVIWQAEIRQVPLPYLVGVLMFVVGGGFLALHLSVTDERLHRQFGEAAAGRVRQLWRGGWVGMLLGATMIAAEYFLGAGRRTAGFLLRFTSVRRRVLQQSRLMAELPDAVFREVERLSEAGNQHAAADQVAQALSCFNAAWELLPEPRVDWSAGLWLLAAIGDVQFQSGQFAGGRETLMTAMKFYGEAPGNPFLRLRLGQCMYELGEEREAANWLAGAFITEGMALFGGEDPKYAVFVKSQLQAPPGGWPEGW